MSDSTLKSYLNRRLSEIQTDDVPEFDSFFKEEELIAPKPRVRLWPTVISVLSMAAAVALLFVFVVDKKVDVSDSLTARQENVSTEEFVSEDHSTQDALNVQEVGIEDREIQAVRGSQEVEDVRTVRSSQKSRMNQVARGKKEQKPSMAENKQQAISDDLLANNYDKSDAQVVEEIQPASTPIETSSSASILAEVPSYERSVAEANAIASANKKIIKKSQRRKVSIAASFNQDNSLMAMAASTSETPVSMITRSYRNSASLVSSSSLRSAPQRKNEWNVPRNLERNAIASYTPKNNLPLTAGLGIAIPISRSLDLQTGLTYSYLSANTVGDLEDGVSFSLYQGIHYLGVPLRVSYRIIDRRWGVYVSVGGGLEKGLAAEQESIVKDASGKITSGEYTTQQVKGLQPYVGAQVGLSYHFAEQFQLYVEPGFSYYFDTEQLISSRTSNPLSFSLGLGLRFLAK